jgi:hypothetical protein
MGVHRDQAKKGNDSFPFAMCSARIQYLMRSINWVQVDYSNMGLFATLIFSLPSLRNATVSVPVI